ncbi:MAG TPA: MarR family transcriptional regulator [Gemmatimonadaceae bacterium]|nr:MarR family transcriptional regulator [Gemmatimonadaceae bacterium]
MSRRSRAVRARNERAFLMQLGPIRQALRRINGRALAPLGISTAQAYPLVLIAQNDGIRQGELADRLDIEGPTLVRMLDQLGALGLVDRRTDPADQRAKTLHLTPAGEALAERVEPVLYETRARILADVPDEDLEVCLRVFDALRAAVENDEAGTLAGAGSS